jgi:PelA/Pel-15E family pectate lyase
VIKLAAAVSALVVCIGANGSCQAQSTDLRQQAVDAMRQAATYYHDQVAVNGGYVYFYSPDLQRRLGEGVASESQIWVQPPGTPTVGLAFLEAYKATADNLYLQAATDAANALIYGQLQSGAWTNSIDFNPRSPATAQYRNGRGKGRNFSTLDDGISQAAIRLLMHVDQAHEFNHREIHEAAQTALDAMLAAQYPNGAFPQGWDDTPHIDGQPTVKASFPDYDWRTEGRIKAYWDMYTLNDGAAGTISATLIDAHAIYGSDRYLQALRSLGDFLIAAQMPAPQSGWAQQYSYDMHPIWARRFEPPAVAGRESQDVIKALMSIYQVTGDDKYLAPIPAALKYLRSSVLPEGLLARYYELRSNRPLYMSRQGRDYSLTYDDSNLPSHYGWKVENEIDQLETRYKQIRQTSNSTQPSDVPDAAEVRRIIDSLDSSGRWISTYAGERLIGQAKFSPGDKYLSSEVFSNNLTTLSQFVTNN